MYGRIIKGVGGFYYVFVDNAGIFECRARGIFRKDGLKPLVGDEVCLVKVEDSGEDRLSGSITGILPRKNELIRPAVANVDQMVLVSACSHPAPDTNLIDRILISLSENGIPVIMIFNKADLVPDGRMQLLKETYEQAGYKVLFTSALTDEGMQAFKSTLSGKTSAFAGPSGVGKSSLINILSSYAKMETGILSQKTERGRHTTRHSELFPLDDGGYVFDTPGFSCVYLPDMRKEELASYFHEFDRYEPGCRFQGCAHVDEPDCGVKTALADGLISRSRYENYKLFYEELKNRRRY